MKAKPHKKKVKPQVTSVTQPTKTWYQHLSEWCDANGFPDWGYPKLFCVRWHDGRTMAWDVDNDGPVYFPNKELAKLARNSLPKGATVIPGPDHHKRIK